jgi:hypothetical protein
LSFRKTNQQLYLPPRPPSTPRNAKIKRIMKPPGRTFPDIHAKSLVMESEVFCIDFLGVLGGLGGEDRC